MQAPPRLASPYLIGISGPSGAGKTELARRLAAMLPAKILSVDSYYRDLAGVPLEQRAGTNFDSPDSIDHDLLALHLALIAAGRGVAIPVYDFTTHTRSPRTHHLHPREFVIVEGLFALYWSDIRERFGTKVFVVTEDQVCFERRLRRDVRERGRSEESVLLQYETTVRPMAARYVLPTRAYADIVASGTDALARSASLVLAHIEAALQAQPGLPL
jgi:uridine kinase